MARSRIARDVYDKTAGIYDEFVTPCRICQFLTLIHELKLKGNERVLEIGSGPGELSVRLAKVLGKGSVTGVDISKGMVAVAKRKARSHMLGNVKFINADASKLEFPSRHFDVVVMSRCLHRTDEPERLVSEIHRVLKKGGKFGMISAAPGTYDEFKQAFAKVAGRYGKYYCGRDFENVVGVELMGDRELEGMLRSAGFELKKRFHMHMKEQMEPERYLWKMTALFGDTYVAPVPEKEREIVRGEILKELRGLFKDKEFKASECSSFIIGIKR